MKAILKAGVFVVGLLGIVIVGLLWYFYLTYIDEVVTEGSAYGYAVGQPKREAFETAIEQFAQNDISGIHIMEPFQTLDPSTANFGIVEQSDFWTVFPAERDDFFDTVKLHFEDERLSKIRRHRQRFELP